MQIRLLISWLLSSLAACKSPGTQYSEWVNLQRYAKENAGLGKPASGEKRVVFTGDSITEWWQKADAAFFAERAYINRGISGQTTAQVLQRFRSDVIALQPAVVVILAGINDIAQNGGPVPVEKTAGNIIAMAVLARQAHITPVICSVLPANRIPWRDGIRPAEEVVRLNTLISNWCVKNNITYVDYYTKMVNAEKGLDPQLAADGLHPTLAGYRIMEPLVEAAIKDNLPAPDQP